MRHVLPRVDITHTNPNAPSDQSLQVLKSQVGSGLGVVEPTSAIPFEVANERMLFVGYHLNCAATAASDHAADAI